MCKASGWEHSQLHLQNTFFVKVKDNVAKKWQNLSFNRSSIIASDFTNCNNNLYFYRLLRLATCINYFPFFIRSSLSSFSLSYFSPLPSLLYGVVADLAWGGEELVDFDSVAWGWWLVFGFLLRFGSDRLLFVVVGLWFAGVDSWWLLEHQIVVGRRREVWWLGVGVSG